MRMSLAITVATVVLPLVNVLRGECWMLGLSTHMRNSFSQISGGGKFESDAHLPPWAGIRACFCTCSLHLLLRFVPALVVQNEDG